ncbi:type II toxin-antitoxin system Phd/YefM family antitoxin [Paenibacillus agricola]|uniref:Antitoxin n=1 Tax=Paenibacillus agricola TaxID=2716264 RepID=A0ABX0JH87_9BACL|nr:type II toxin-antitoxin system Phd/YefM family antitoxin [Paenibacillus agricola]NHN33206.1 type II toxin-antitoxin system Phd/YefM family antitoxin [Paenibacillus agricola]
MLIIRPITELRNNFNEISRIVHEDKEPVILTKNGYGDMVVMSLEYYENMQINMKLKESEIEAANTDERVAHEEVIDKARGQILNSKV